MECLQNTGRREPNKMSFLGIGTIVALHRNSLSDKDFLCLLVSRIQRRSLAGGKFVPRYSDSTGFEEVCLKKIFYEI